MKDHIYKWKHLKNREIADENNRKNSMFRLFQDFQSKLTMGEMQSVRRHIIAIEKALFWKGGVI
jgi:hypothetical protein